MSMARGVRKVSENIVQDGRALIITEEDANKLKWENIPNGTIKVNPKNGLMMVKLEGETDWLPSGLKNDGTLCIIKDSMIIHENFTVTSVPERNSSGTYTTNEFTYKNSDGETRHMPITIDNEFVFELEKGSYIKNRNHLSLAIDDCLEWTPSTGGVREINETRFAVTELLEVGHKITAKYIRIFRIGNPYPRIFFDANEPEHAEIGDLWLDIDAQIESDEYLPEDVDGKIKIDWSMIEGLPTTLQGYGINDPVARIGHVHRVLDMTDFPLSLPANGGNADTVGGYRPGVAANRLLITDAIGKIPIGVIPTSGINADTLKQLTIPNGTSNTQPNVIVRTNASGQIEIKEIKIEQSATTSTRVDSVFVDIGDGIMRKVPMANFKDSLGGAEVVVLTGSISNGGTVPLPNGYSEAECTWVLMPRQVDATGHKYNNSMRCYCNGRVAYLYHDEDTLYATYLVIGVKK